MGCGAWALSCGWLKAQPSQDIAPALTGKNQHHVCVYSASHTTFIAMPAYSLHPDSRVETKQIGKGTRVWAFAHILPGAVLGEECNVCDGVFIENDVIVGHRVTIKCGVQLWDGMRVEDDVFIGPNATFANDAFPRSRQAFVVRPTVVRKGASIGANATVLPGITIGKNAMVGAGAVVTRDVPPNAIVVGNPARIVGYGAKGGKTRAASDTATDVEGAFRELAVAGASLHRLPRVDDLRGALVYGELGQQLPFKAERAFVVFDVPSREVRGEHAHRELHEFMVCLRGSCSIALDDGKYRDEIELNDPSVGLHVQPRLWRVHYKYSPDAVLMVLCSHRYDPNDYIRDYDDFLVFVGAG